MPPAGSLLTPAQTAHTRILCIFIVFANEVMEEDLLKARKSWKHSSSGHFQPLSSGNKFSEKPQLLHQANNWIPLQGNSVPTLEMIL